MKSMMRRTTLREIWQSLGRYLAIFAIVAMGVGFFAGLKITRPVMVESANAYLGEKQLYDYRLLSTLGFEEEDVAALAAKDDVRAAVLHGDDMVFLPPRAAGGGSGSDAPQDAASREARLSGTGAFCLESFKVSA